MLFDKSPKEQRPCKESTHVYHTVNNDPAKRTITHLDRHSQASHGGYGCSCVCVLYTEPELCVKAILSIKTSSQNCKDNKFILLKCFISNFKSTHFK